MPLMGDLSPFPQTLPPNTVVGRTGISSGPTEAIPFSILKSAIGVTLFDSASIAATSLIASSVNAIRTAGYYNPGDGGDALYFKAGGSTPGGFQSADGAWWAIADVFSGSVRARQFGVVTNGSTDDAPFLNNAIAALVATGMGGGTLKLSGYQYTIKSTVTVPNTVVPAIQGESATFNVATDVTALQINSSFTHVSDLTVNGYGVQGQASFGATNPAIHIGNCGNVILENVNSFGGSNNILNEGFDNIFLNVKTGYSFSDMFKNTNGAVWVNRCQFDQGFPVSFPAPGTTFSARQNTHAYNQGDCVTLSGFVIQCTVAGTSGGSAPALKNFSQNISDGTATWQLACPVNPVSQHVGAGCSEYHATLTDNTFPMLIDGGGDEVFVDNSVFNGIIASVGKQLYLDSNELHGAVGGYASGEAVTIGASWTGSTVIKGNEISGSGTSCIHLLGGTNAIIAENNFDSPGTTNGVLVDAGVTDFIISANTIRNTTNPVVISTGASDYYDVVNNLIHGSVTDGGSGVNKTLSGNH